MGQLVDIVRGSLPAAMRDVRPAPMTIFPTTAPTWSGGCLTHTCTKSNSRPLIGGVSGAKKLARTATVHTCISPQVADMTGADCTPRHFASFMESVPEPFKCD